MLKHLLPLLAILLSFTATTPAGAAAATAYFIHSDQLDTPRVVSDQSGAAVWTWDSDAFGNDAPNEQPTGGARFVNNLRFPGQYADAETRLHYNYYRDYDPKMGRYVQSDPIGLAGGINTYGYGLGNPISNRDPQGLLVPLVIPFVCAAGGCEAAGVALAAGALWWGINNPIANSGKDVQSTSASASVAECKPDKKDPCEEIRKKIRDIEQKLTSKERQLNNPKFDLFNRAYDKNPGGDLAGKGTWVGHVDQINGLKTGLERAKAQARAMGCL